MSIGDKAKESTNTVNQCLEEKTTFTSGATSSKGAIDYHLVPHSFTYRVAKRFSVGKETHGDVNYQKCIKTDFNNQTVELDVAFARDRYNHCLQHLENIRDVGNDWDDNIGAAGWFLAFACWVEEKGFDWRRILTPRYVNEVTFRIYLENPTCLGVITKDGTLHSEPRFELSNAKTTQR